MVAASNNNKNNNNNNNIHFNQNQIIQVSNPFTTMLYVSNTHHEITTVYSLPSMKNIAVPVFGCLNGKSQSQLMEKIWLQ